MKEMKYVITNPEGLAARLAGILVQNALKFSCEIQLVKGEMDWNCKRIMGVMGLGIKQGDEVTFTFDGADEEKAYNEISRFVEENL